MTYNPGHGLYSREPYQSPEQYPSPDHDGFLPTLIDPRLHETLAPDDRPFAQSPNQIQQFLEEASPKSVSPWPDREHFFFPGAFGTVATPAPDQYVPSESSASLQWSSGSSIQNGQFDMDTWGGPSTPGETRVLSPGTDIDSAHQGDGYGPAMSLTGLVGQPGPLLGYPAAFGHSGEYGSMLDIDMEEVTPVEGSYSHLSATPQSTVADESEMESSVPDITSPMTDLPDDSEKSCKADVQSMIVNGKPAPGRVGKQDIRHGTRRSSAKRVEKPQARGNQKRLQKSLLEPTRTDLVCRQCNNSFKDEATLDKHTKTMHTRPFICVFHYAGCKSTFAAKNEWKRHVASQHLYLEYYHCDYKECASTKPAANKHRSKTLPQHGAIFNRKDLYTQHVRRMHQPQNLAKKPARQWDEQVKEMQKKAHHTRCELPREMTCPAPNCKDKFHGEKAWDERMEHVARHLELAAAGKEDPVRFGGPYDLCLTNWAESPRVDVVRRVGDVWKLNNPVKGGGDSTGSSPSSTLDEDAEGEPLL